MPQGSTSTGFCVQWDTSYSYEVRPSVDLRESIEFSSTLEADSVSRIFSRMYLYKFYTNYDSVVEIVSLGSKHNERRLKN